MYLNKVFIIGNLTRDPELKSLPSGTKVTNFSVATNRVWKDQAGQKQEATEYHNIVVFARQAETVAQYLKKGSNVLIEGRIQTRSWDAEDGGKRYKTEIVAERVQFGPKSGGGSPTGTRSTQDSQNSQDSQEIKEEVDTIQYPDEDINPEDIPF